MKHSVATYEQTKKGLSYLYPKRLVEEDGIHNKPLDLYIFLSMLSCSFMHSFYLFLWSCSSIHSN